MATLKASLYRFDLSSEYHLAEENIRSEFHLNRRRGAGSNTLYERGAELAALKEDPEYAFAFVFHGDGRIREAALNAYPANLSQTLNFYAILSRLNDWSPEVRSAAQNALARALTETSTEIIAEAMLPVLVVGQTWTRWTKGYQTLLDILNARDDVVAHLANVLCIQQIRGVARVFFALQFCEVLDPLLANMARHAKMPCIRARGLRCLLTSEARWPTGLEHIVWIDKSMGKSRMQSEWNGRPLTCDVDILEFLLVGLEDISLQVRRVALDGVIQYRERPEFAQALEKANALGLLETNPSMLERIDFLKRKSGLS